MQCPQPWGYWSWGWAWELFLEAVMSGSKLLSRALAALLRAASNSEGLPELEVGG